MFYRVLMPIGICLMAFVSGARADLITIDLRGNSAFDFNDPSGTVTFTEGILSGLSITVTALVNGVALNDSTTDGTEGVNTVADGLVVNAPGIDVTGALDGRAGLESLLFEFDDPGTLASLTLNSVTVNAVSFAGADAGEITFGSSSPPGISLVDNVPTSVSSSPDLLGSSFTIAFTGDDSTNGFAIQSFALNTTAVPEMSSLALVGVAGLGGMLRRRRRKVVVAA